MKTNISDKDIRAIREQLQNLEKKKRDPKSLERAIKAETEGMGFLEAERRANELREQWQIATEQTTGMMSGFLTGLFGQDLGKLLSKKYAKADEDQIKQAQEYFDKFKKSEDKKDKVTAKKSERTAREFTGLKKTVVDIQKNVNLIRKSLTGKSTPEVKPGFFFDTRMAGGGRFKEAATNKIVSKDVALKRTDALTKAIMADEDPMLRLADTVEQIFKSLGQDNKSVHDKLDDIENKLDYMDSDSDDIDIDIDRRRRRTPRKTPRKTPTKKPQKGPGKVGNVLRKVGRFTMGTGAQVAAAVGTVALVTGGAAYMASGRAADDAKDSMKELERKYGLKVLYNSKGATIGYSVNGKKYGLTDLPQEYQDLINVYGPGDKRSFAAVESLKRIKANPEKYKALEIGAKRAPTPTVNIKVPQVSAKPVSIPTTQTTQTEPSGKISSAVSSVKKTVSSAIKAGGAATMATGAAMGAGGGAVVSAAKTGVDKVKDIIVNAAKRIGVNPGIMLAMGQQESSFNPSAQPYMTDKKTGERKLLSSAKGIFQFINSTWDSMVKKYAASYPELTRGAFDPEANAIAGALYVKENSQFLQKKGIPVTGTSIYATHFLGPGGAAKLFSAPKDAIASEVMPAPAKANPHIFFDKGKPKTIQEVIDTLYKKVGSKAEQFQAQVDSGKIGGNIGAEPTQPMYASTTKPSATPSVTPSPSASPSVSPVQSASGTTVQQQSEMLASNQMAMQAPVAPVVNNVVNQAPASAAPQTKAPMIQASARPADSSFTRALARDFAHPSAFTTVSLV